MPASTGHAVRARNPRGGPADDSGSRHGDPASGVRCGIEWWFVQGWYDATDARRAFMAALLQRHGRTGDGRSASASSLLLSVLDPTRPRHEFVSRVDAGVVPLLRAASPALTAGGADDAYLRAYLDEFEAGGPPAPITIADRPPEVERSPLRVTWDGFSLTEDRGAFTLAFREPGTDRRVRLSMASRQPPLSLGPVRAFGDGGMQYVVEPHLTVRGRAGSLAVSGEAWFERQWGGLGLLFDRAGAGALLGWNWLGASFDDGTRLLLFEHWDVTQPARRTRWGVLVGSDGQAVRRLRFSARPLRRWRSDRTRTAYPVEWEYRIPGIGARLRFAPAVDDQEIPIVGPGRAIWEGAGGVSGVLDGRVVSGPARLELQGYGYVVDPAAAERRAAERIDRTIARFFPQRASERTLRRYAGRPRWRHEPDAYTAGLFAPVWDLIERGGRRWRPLLGLLLVDALGGRAEQYETLIAVTAELPHTAALIVDDIEDRSEIRRGAASVHIRFGLDVALNAANTAYFIPYALLARHPHLDDGQRLALYRILSDQTLKAHLGQVADIYWSRHLTPRRLRAWRSDSILPKVLQAYAYKTGAVAEAVAGAACVLARADSATRERCEAFARVFGVAFQIVDDVRGCVDARRLRKDEGDDIADGKMTYVVLRALDRLPPASARRLGQIVCSPSLRGDPAAVREGVELVRVSGVADACLREASRMADRAWARARSVIPPSEARVLLRALCRRLLEVPNAGRWLPDECEGRTPPRA
jgi:geranylgeranyl pyrophosphate synthase/predicted secreted hydrolase